MLRLQMLILRLYQEGRQNKELGSVLINHILVEADMLTRIGEAGAGDNVVYQFGTRTGGGLAIVGTADGLGEAVQAEAAQAEAPPSPSFVLRPGM